jgi:hypothetical protein
MSGAKNSITKTMSYSTQIPMACPLIQGYRINFLPLIESGILADRAEMYGKMIMMTIIIIIVIIKLLVLSCSAH